MAVVSAEVLITPDWQGPVTYAMYRQLYQVRGVLVLRSDILKKPIQAMLPLTKSTITPIRRAPVRIGGYSNSPENTAVSLPSLRSMTQNRMYQ